MVLDKYERVVTIACVNFATKWADKAANLNKIKDMTKAAAEKKASQALVLNSAAAVQRSGRILLAEDNPINQAVAGNLLRSRGYDLTIANNGREAVERYQAAHFDIVLMDVQMPEMSGFEATAALRGLQAVSGAHTPIIAMTAHAMQGDEQKCLDMGMDAYISKPIHSAKLYALLDRYLLGAEGAPLAATPAPAAISDTQIFDLHTALENLGGDLDLLRQVATMFIENHAEQLAELEQKILGADALGLREVAHRLKGSLGAFAAHHAMERAKALEMMGKAGELQQAQEVFVELRDSMLRLIEFLKTI